eukprot:2693683-Prymnesium_polylepis.1
MHLRQHEVQDFVARPICTRHVELERHDPRLPLESLRPHQMDLLPTGHACVDAESAFPEKSELVSDAVELGFAQHARTNKGTPSSPVENLLLEGRPHPDVCCSVGSCTHHAHVTEPGRLPEDPEGRAPGHVATQA